MYCCIIHLFSPPPQIHMKNCLNPIFPFWAWWLLWLISN